MKRKLLFSVLLMSLIFSMSSVAHSTRELQFENEKVRVWKTMIPPHDQLELHRHAADRVVIGLKGGLLKRIEATGEESDLKFEFGKAYWLPKDPEGTLHGDLNVSSQAVEVMVIELKH